MCIRRLAWLIALAALVRADLAGAEPPARWLLLSDVHFDPLASPAAVPALVARPVPEWRAILEKAGGQPSDYGADANYPLLASALAAMWRTRTCPRWWSSPATCSPITFASTSRRSHRAGRISRPSPRRLSTSWPASSTRPFPDPSSSWPWGTTTRRVATTAWSRVGRSSATWHRGGSPVNRGGRAPDFAKGFAAGGLYTALLLLPGAPQVVVLDTVLWSCTTRAMRTPGRSNWTPWLPLLELRRRRG